MPSSPRKLYLRLSLLVVISCLVLGGTIAGLEALSDFDLLHNLLVGFALGTLFQHPILAGTWAALGPGGWQARLGAAFGWTNAIGLACTLGILNHPGGDDWLLLWIMVLAGWLVTLALLGTARMVLHIRLLPRDFQPSGAFRAGQFGLGQLCLLTAVTSVLIGVTRWVVLSSWYQEFLFWGLIVGSLMVASLPCLLATFLPLRRQVAWGTLVGLVFASAVTVGLLPLWSKVLGSPSWPEVSLIVSMNVCGLIWVAIFALIVRGSGYRFRSAAELTTPVLEPRPEPARSENA